METATLQSSWLARDADDDDDDSPMHWLIITFTKKTVEQKYLYILFATKIIIT